MFNCITRCMVLGLVILCASLAWAADPTIGQATLKSYDVALVALEQPMTITDEMGKTATYTQTYLVRLHGDFPTKGAQVMRLYFGDELIQQYGGLADGIYFMVFEKAKLTKLAGKEIRFRFANEALQASKTVFSLKRFNLKKAVPEREAVERPAF